MRLPKDRVLSSNLQTSFTDYVALLRYLGEEHFDGYVALHGEGYRAWLFMAGGDVMGARDDTGETGPVAVRAFESNARRAGFCLNVYRAPAAQMRLLGSDGEVEPLFPPLPSDFVNLHRMMDTLSRSKHSGYVQLTMRAGDSIGYVLFEDGEPTEAILTDGGHADTGLALVPSIVEAVEKTGAEITVFRTIASREAAERSRDGEPRELDENAPLSERDANEVAAAWSAIFTAVAEVVDGVGEPGSFDTGLREALSEHDDTYPFLDTGRGRLTYQHGEVTFVAPPTASVSLVLGECLNEAIARISFRSRMFDLEARVQQRLETVGQTHGALIRRHGIARAAAPFLAA